MLAINFTGTKEIIVYVVVAIIIVAAIAWFATRGRAKT